MFCFSQILEFVLGFYFFFNLGVYQVNIDSDQQKVTVQGSVDSENLVKKLVRAGKHAELWSQKTNQTQKQKSPCIKDDKNNKGKKMSAMKGIESLKNKQKFSFEEEDDDEDEDYNEGDEMQMMRNKMNNLALLKQQAEANSKKGNVPMNNNAAAANANGNGNSRGGKKGNQDQKTFAPMKMNNEQHLGGQNISHDAAKRANDINAMMNLAGFNGNGGALGGNSGGFPFHGGATGHIPSPLMMNRQPQMMYNRSPFVQPSTGYYYNYGHGYGGEHASAHMFSDDNTSSCRIM